MLRRFGAIDVSPVGTFSSSHVRRLWAHDHVVVEARSDAATIAFARESFCVGEFLQLGLGRRAFDLCEVLSNEWFLVAPRLRQTTDEPCVRWTDSLSESGSYMYDTGASDGATVHFTFAI